MWKSRTGKSHPTDRPLIGAVPTAWHLLLAEFSTDGSGRGRKHGGVGSRRREDPRSRIQCNSELLFFRGPPLSFLVTRDARYELDAWLPLWGLFLAIKWVVSLVFLFFLSRTFLSPYQLTSHIYSVQANFSKHPRHRYLVPVGSPNTTDGFVRSSSWGTLARASQPL